MLKPKKPDTEFGKILAENDFVVPQAGDTIKGTVISASKAEVRLDINGFTTGIVRGREMYLETEQYSKLQPGDEIEATIIDLENENGELELSFRHAGEKRAWQGLAETYKNKTPIQVRIIEANRGGLLVSYLQIRGFLPVSQLSPEHYPRVSGGDKNKILEKLKELVGKDLTVKIITLEQQEDKLVFSEKEAWNEKQHDVLQKYQVGAIIEGKITAITNFGIFISFGENLEGLIHISELAWQRIDDPADLYKVGDTIKAEIISLDGSKIFLSSKKLQNDPWRQVLEKYQVGQVCSGMILKVNPFGLFIELDADIHGLAHVSQLGLKAGQKIDQVFKPGDKCDFVVMSVVPTEHRLGLAIASEKNIAKAKSGATEQPETITEQPETITEQPEAAAE